MCPGTRVFVCAVMSFTSAWDIIIYYIIYYILHYIHIILTPCVGYTGVCVCSHELHITSAQGILEGTLMIWLNTEPELIIRVRIKFSWYGETILNSIGHVDSCIESALKRIKSSMRQHVQGSRQLLFIVIHIICMSWVSGFVRWVWAPDADQHHQSPLLRS